MKKTFLVIFLLSLGYSLRAQQYCLPGRFDTNNIFSEVNIDSVVIQFGQNTDWNGSATNLFMTMYYPDMSVDTLSRRPFVMLIHGGSFRNGSRYDLISEVKYFAEKGYVCATIDYRLGWAGSNPANCTGDNELHINAVYRAVQDAKAALRVVSAHATTYRIDSTQMLVGGTSSGAFTSLALAFISENDFNVLKPGISNLLGSLNSSSNTLTDPYFLKGILSYKGAIWDSSVINSTNAIPTIFIHGTADPYYPYLTGPAYSCINYFTMMGSGYLSKRLDKMDVCYELNYKVNGDHGEIYPASYTLGRRVLFMKRILCDACLPLIIENQVEVQDTTNVDDIFLNENKYSIEAHPNPVSERLHISCNSEDTYNFEIFNTAMQKILTGMFQLEYSIDFTEIPKGIYFLFVFDKKNKLIDKVKIVK